MGKKIRNAEQQKVPYILIAGGEDEAAGAVSFRYRDRTQKNGVPSTRRSPRSPTPSAAASRSDSFDAPIPDDDGLR